MISVLLSLVIATPLFEVVVVVGLQDLFSKFLLPLMDISVQFISVFSNRELLVVIDRDIDFLVADGLIIGVVELSNIRVSQTLLS